MLKKPNIIYIFCDQLRRQAIGYMNEDPVVTPHIDRFARESVVFKQAISNNPVCSPYRGILFTGMYANKNHIFTNCNSKSAQQGCYLREDQVCLSDILAQNGYNMGYIGKWHLDQPRAEHNMYTEGPRGNGVIWDAYTPPGKARHGFEFWYSYGCYDFHMHPHYWVNDAKVEERIDVDEWSVQHETNVATRYIKTAKEPFSLFVSFNPPHTDFDMLPEKYLSYYSGKNAEDLLVRPNVKPCQESVEHVKNYFAAITGVDEQFGKIMESIESRGIKDNTIVIFTSDHGEMMGSHGRMYKNIWYEESIGVPFIIRYPKLYTHHETDAQLSTIDIFPTMLGMVGLENQIPKSCKGHNFAPHLEKAEYKNTPSCALYFLDDKEKDGYGRGIRDERYTFVVAGEEQSQKYFLYDRQKDYYQEYNVADENPDIVAKYKAILKAELERIEDVFKV